jgi:predicted MFS family arabinose efflux permease
VLTEYLDWRWVFYVNVPIACWPSSGALAYVPESRDESARGFDVAGRRHGHRRPDGPGLRAGQVNDDTVSTGTKTLFFALAAVLLAAFVVVQGRSRTRWPFRLFRSRSLLGADVGALFIGAGIFGIFFFLTLWMQVLNGYSPIRPASRSCP